ncbi:MAG: hypothetical protein ACI30R_07665 [Sodaliphilus sp.]
MKKVILMLVALMICATGCKKASYFYLDKKEVTVPRSGGVDSIAMHSDVEGFDVEAAPEWVEAEVVDSTLILKFAENTLQTERLGEVEISVRGASVKLPIRQIYMATKLNPDTTKVEFEKEGGTKTVKIETDGEVKFDAPKKVKAVYQNGELVITADRNDAGTINENIVLKADSLSATITVKVKGNLCKTCGGTGKVRCKACNGRGYNIVIGGTAGFRLPLGCMRCGGRMIMPHGGGYGYDAISDGTGRVTCPTCRGTGIAKTR